MQPEPIRDIAHLGHVEILTAKFAESAKFFIDVMGMTQSGEKGDSVYLRGWDDYERYSLKLTAAKTSGMGHAAFRTRSPQALERRAAALKGSGFDVGWSDGDLGHGKTFVCKDPDGHVIELYYDTEWYQAPPGEKPALKNQAQRYPARGCNVRRIDHFNGLAVDIKANREFFQNYLGFMLTEQIVLDDGTEAGMWLTCTNKSYDFAYTREAHGVGGRFHVLRVHQAEAGVGGQEQAPALVGPGRLHCRRGSGMRAHLGRRAGSCGQAPHVRRRLQLHVDALRAVLEVPGALRRAFVVAFDELAQLAMLDAAALGERERAGGLRAVVAHVPVAACIERQPAGAGRHVGPFLQGGANHVVHAVSGRVSGRGP